MSSAENDTRTGRFVWISDTEMRLLPSKSMHSLVHKRWDAAPADPAEAVRDAIHDHWDGDSFDSDDADTVRVHLEAIVSDLNSTDVSYTSGMVAAGVHATLALRELDAGRPCLLTPCMRMWSPDRLAQAQAHCDQHGCGKPVIGRFVCDPSPESGDATEAITAWFYANFHGADESPDAVRNGADEILAALGFPDSTEASR